MKLTRMIILAGLLTAAIGLTGCGAWNNFTKHVHSAVTGLDRKVTLYNSNGGVIKEWVTRAKVEDNGGTCYFLDSNGKAVTVSGTFIVQEQ